MNNDMARANSYYATNSSHLTEFRNSNDLIWEYSKRSKREIDFARTVTDIGTTTRSCNIIFLTVNFNLSETANIQVEKYIWHDFNSEAAALSNYHRQDILVKIFPHVTSI